MLLLSPNVLASGDRGFSVIVGILFDGATTLVLLTFTERFLWIAGITGIAGIILRRVELFEATLAPLFDGPVVDAARLLPLVPVFTGG